MSETQATRIPRHLWIVGGVGLLFSVVIFVVALALFIYARSMAKRVCYSSRGSICVGGLLVPFR